ncbi:oligopeptidase A [Methylococcus sp. EFPC2]|uniref:oligopeptidase A n=1 Tax=Methylococcus sp. EFPC2 TaxID=2812648 RepID=UPI001967A46A|nr:oligopeptidase A [Methylococcus sp. EFPC2]QSA96074.1 oligopeptidase A [Methylococcus sp. EFPC2]
MTNPLLEPHDLPPFSVIRPEHVEPAIRRILDENRQAIAALLQEGNEYRWDNLAAPMEDLDDRLSRTWGSVGHLNAVVNSDALREAYNACLPLISDYSTEVGQNAALCQGYRQLAESPEFTTLEEAQRKIVENALRDFRLSGVDLPAEQKARYKEIAQELSRLTSQFQDNLLDATQAWTKHIEDEAQLAGIPESARAVARQTAERQGKSGWIFTLEFPSYYAIINYADDRELRREFYSAYATRASELGPKAGQWDNGPLMERILALRHEEARLLGYANYAELSLATKMARNTVEVTAFLEDLARRSLPVARRDLEELRAFAREQHGLDQLESWDLGYYSEKLREHAYALSEEELKPYFPANRVVAGMFAVVDRLYGLKIRELKDVDVWHPDVRYYEIRDRDGELRGSFYLDLYARPNKRGGAWMDECIPRRRLSTSVQSPVAYLICNFTPPAGTDPVLLRHDEVLTLFHEFGHGLHHMLTKVDHLGVSGIHGVEWDAVELPSQFMENFCWEREALDLIAGHYQTGDPLPQALFDKMIAARNFQSGMQMVRQLEFSLFDFRIHKEYAPSLGGRVYQILEDVRAQTAVFIPPAFNRFPHSFSHIFAGGYAAGYYSYKWAEVLSSDAFALFEEQGIFDPETGRAFLEKILERGGSREALESFTDFRGREPQIDALLRHSGIAA